MESWEILDKSEIAADAAVEIDNLIIGRGKDYNAALNLAKFISESLFREIPNAPQGVLDFDASVVVILHHAMLDAKVIENRLQTVADLRAEAQPIIELLRSVSYNPEKCRVNQPDELKKLRGLCISLSKQLFAEMPPMRQRAFALTSA